MAEGPSIAPIAALIGDPARANVLAALLDGRALTVSELAEAAGVGLPTTSGHLAKLAEAGLVCGDRQGRHRYFRLAGPDVALVLETLMSLAARTGPRRVRTGPRDPELRRARVCYDHLAGERAVAMLDSFYARGLLTGEGEPVLSEAGRAFFTARGLDLERLERQRRPLCRTCLDWSERRAHLAGALGAAVLDQFLTRGWARRSADRSVVFTPIGAGALMSEWGLPAS